MREIVFNMRKMFGLGEFNFFFFFGVVRCTGWSGGCTREGKEIEHWEEMHSRTGRVTTSCGTPRGGKAQPYHELDVTMRGTLIHNILHEEPKVEEYGWLYAPHPERLIASRSLLCSPPRMNGGHSRT